LSKSQFYAILEKNFSKGNLMISLLQGIVHSIRDQSIIVLSGSIGFDVHVSHPQSFKEQSQIELFVHMHWNQEQGPALFGFRTQEEKRVFLLATSCSGIGPKIALALLEFSGAASFVQAIITENTAALSAVPGVGKRKAEQLIVHLKEKVSRLVQQGILNAQNSSTDFQQISEVLTSLNYTRTEVNFVLDSLRKSDHASASFDLLLRKALSLLSKKA
jgi:Holliday junction DNA helicase RuvA